MYTSNELAVINQRRNAKAGQKYIIATGVGVGTLYEGNLDGTLTFITDNFDLKAQQAVGKIIESSTSVSSTYNPLIPEIVSDLPNSGVSPGTYGNGKIVPEITVNKEGIVLSITNVPIIYQTSAKGITAFAGGGQANATLLNFDYNRVDIVATPGDSVKCDPAIVNSIKYIFNTAGIAMDLFPAIGEQFENGVTLLGLNTPISIDGGNSIKMICYATGVWSFT